MIERVRVYQVGFTPIYTPFYISLGLLKRKGIIGEIQYIVGPADRHNLYAACKNKKSNNNDFIIVLTALHNIEHVRGILKPHIRVDRICEDCDYYHNNKTGNKDCLGIDEDIEWHFPWVFIVKLPVYIFYKGKEIPGDIKERLNKTSSYSIGGKFITLFGFRDILKEKNRKIFIYPPGSTIYNMVIDHFLGQDKKIKNYLNLGEINFNREHKNIENIEEDDVFIVTLNPLLYLDRANFHLISKPMHNYFPFTGIAIPTLKKHGTTTKETTFVYSLESAYLKIMNIVQKEQSIFFYRTEGGKALIEFLGECLRDGLPKEGHYENLVFEGDRIVFNNDYIDNDMLVEDYILDNGKFLKFYNDGLYREQQTDTIEEYLCNIGSINRDNSLSQKNIEAMNLFDTQDITAKEIILFDKKLYVEKVKDAVASVMARNLSHIYGSNVLPYIVKGESLSCEAQKFIDHLTNRMDYIAWLVGDTILTRKSFMPWEPEINDKGELSILSQYFKSTSAKSLWMTQGFDDIYFKYCFDFDKNNPPVIGLPPAVGLQAILSIFENIVRNSAKYMRPNKSLNKDKDINTMFFSIHISPEKNTDFYKITVVDEQDFPENTSPEQVVEDLNNFFATSMVDFKNNIVKKYWGLKEIKISCAFLLNIPMEKVDFASHLPEFKAIKNFRLMNVKLKDGKINYEFYVWRYKYIDRLNEAYSINRPVEFILSDNNNDFGYTRILSARERDIEYLKKLWLSKLSGGKNIRLYMCLEDDDSEAFSQNRSVPVRDFYINKDKPTLEIAFCRHGIKNAEEDIIEKLHYFQAFSGGSKTSAYVFRALNDDFTAYKLAEAALLKVLIIDERVQEFVSKDSKFLEELKKMNIYVFDKKAYGYEEVIKNEDRFKEFAEELKKVQKDFNPHIVVVHVSLLEQADRHIGDRRFYKELNSIFKEKGSDILITTGRGMVLGFYGDEYKTAVPISAIINSISERDKVQLANLLIGFNREVYIWRCKEGHMKS